VADSPLGFLVDDKSLQRAGLDYWQHLDWEVVDSWAEVQRKLPDARVWCLTKTGSRAPWDVEFAQGDILLFGSESRGLPASILQESAARNLRLPMRRRSAASTSPAPSTRSPTKRCDSLAACPGRLTQVRPTSHNLADFSR
jgi:tRNA(Leu) C34 or U34 (ribose-2'-O)-methylase TrmL